MKFLERRTSIKKTATLNIACACFIFSIERKTYENSILLVQMGCLKLPYKEEKPTQLKVCWKRNGQENRSTGVENFLFNGIERETELDLGWDLAHYRAYDPAIGRWLQIDPKTSERESPYVGFANAPNFYIDPLGDTINISGILSYDKVNNTNYGAQIVSGLSTLTGLTLSTDKSGNINYAKDDDGNAIVATENIDELCTCSEKGSSSARQDLIGAINGDRIAVSSSPNRSATPRGGNEIFLSPTQVDGFINGTPSDVNRETMGFGMTLLHEYQHTGPGGSQIDVPDRNNTSDTGPTVDRVNTYRSELDNNLSNSGSLQYGQRDHYNANPSSNGGSVNFRLKRYNKKGKRKNRNRRITF